MKNNYKLISAILFLTFLASRAGAQCLASALVPYYEGFNSITQNNELPACWAASNMSVTCLTYTGTGGPGNKGAFYHNPAGVNYFHSRSLYLNAGITYSATVWHAGSASGSNWTDLSLMYGPGQSPAGLTLVAGTGTAGTTMNYTSLTGTFTVASSGTYYMAIRGTGTSGTAQYLYFDDLNVTIPCSLNSPTITVSGPTLNCTGQPVTYTVSGADTYTWNNGGHNPVNTYTASPNQVTVSATSTLSGCTAFALKNVTLSPTPLISVFMPDPTHTICAGKSTILYALGTAVTYTWSDMQQGSTITCVPGVTTIYTVMGTTAEGCIGTQTIGITVKPLPVVSGASQRATICEGESTILTGNGASTYSWMPGGLSGSSVAISPTVQTTYTLTGTDAATGCSNTATVIQNVDKCLGISNVTGNNSIVLYPNPNHGRFTLLTNSNEKNIHIYDLSGRMVLSENTSLETIKFDLSNFANGLYYVKIQSALGASVIKVLKE